MQSELKMMLCYRVSMQQETNQMSAANLGIVFGPTLLRPRYISASFSADPLLF